MTRLSIFRKPKSILGFLAFPAAVASVVAFSYLVYPDLSPKVQDTIDNGGLGMILGLFMGLALWTAFQISWFSELALFRKEAA